MCGIAGIVNFSSEAVDPAAIQDMMNRIKHRGPDDEGMFLRDHVGIGHVRLSIIDLSSAGHQPMFSNDDRYAIVFNGEIYNYVELREELKDGYSFRSKTDTEVLLAAYIKWGEQCLPRLNGDFAFAIYDTREKTLFGARDRFGIKPFYIYRNEQRFVFASEIKSVLPLVDQLTPNEKSLYEYLVYNRTDQSDETFFDSVHKLHHGHCFTIRNGKVDIRKWYDLKEQVRYPSPMTPGQYREEFRKSVGLRLRSDVPVGVCLSGGIDSSAVTSVLYHDFNLKEVKTFSAVFEKGSWADESPFINAFQAELNNMFYIQPTAETFYDEFKGFVTAQCEPIPGVSPYSQYKVMQLASQNVSVTLDGQGADEMLGGYNYFYGGYFKELLRSLKWITLCRELIGYGKRNPSKDAYAYFLFYLLPQGLKKYAGRKTYGSISTEFYEKYKNVSTISSDLYDPRTLHDSFLQHFEHKLEHLLKWDDLNSMRFSIESRVPFLDHNLVEKTLSLPPDLVLKNGVSKYIMRESVRDILPAAIYNRRDKKGFTTPSDEWFRSKAFQAYIQDMLHSAAFKQRGYFNVEDCQKKYQAHIEGKGNFSKDIWKWINLEEWFRIFINR
ncbi:MAG: asparagine synthase (glutamine-hydrolyzing) [Flavobacteriales bacterium]|nr:asparagine synthase (glutamine-hydrolyzing) [Flavobacteriales bacterium]